MNRRELFLGVAAVPIASAPDRDRQIGHEIARALDRCGSPFQAAFGGHSWACDRATEIVRRELNK